MTTFPEWNGNGSGIRIRNMCLWARKSTKCMITILQKRGSERPTDNYIPSLVSNNGHMISSSKHLPKRSTLLELRARLFKIKKSDFYIKQSSNYFWRFLSKAKANLCSFTIIKITCF